MGRVKGWETALFAATSAAQQRAHVWGETDCIMFAARCVLAMTGEDLAHDVRGKYDSPESAARLIKREGFDSLGDMVASYLPELAVSMAQRGDLVLCDGPDGDFIAVVQGHTAVGPTSRGLIHVPVSQATRAYRVGL